MGAVTGPDAQNRRKETGKCPGRPGEFHGVACFRRDGRGGEPGRSGFDRLDGFCRTALCRCSLGLAR